MEFHSPRSQDGATSNTQKHYLITFFTDQTLSAKPKESRHSSDNILSLESLIRGRTDHWQHFSCL